MSHQDLGWVDDVEFGMFWVDGHSVPVGPLFFVVPPQVFGTGWRDLSSVWTPPPPCPRRRFWRQVSGLVAIVEIKGVTYLFQNFNVSFAHFVLVLSAATVS